MAASVLSGDAPPPSFSLPDDIGDYTDIFDSVSGGDLLYVQYLGVSDTDTAESVQAMQADLAVLNENVADMNSKFTLLISVLVVLIAWKLVTVSNKFFSWLF